MDWVAFNEVLQMAMLYFAPGIIAASLIAIFTDHFNTNDQGDDAMCIMLLVFFWPFAILFIVATSPVMLVRLIYKIKNRKKQKQ